MALNASRPHNAGGRYRPPIGSDRRSALAVVLLCAGCWFSCGEDSVEAKSVLLPVVVDSSGVTVVNNDLGYAIVVDGLHAAIADLAFTTGGETHARNEPNLFERILVRRAHAHAGHYAGDYNGANFTFVRAGADDGLTVDEPLFGHTFEISGTASRDGTSTRFSVVLDQDDGREMVGAPFDLEVSETTSATLGFRILTQDPYEPDTLFDGIDFFALDSPDGDTVVIESGSEVYNRLRRNLQVHDHYAISVQQGGSR